MTSIASMPSSTALPVARDWFRIRPAGDALAVIDEPHVHELLRANIWLFHGQDRDLLFDSGLGVASLRTALDGSIAPYPVLVLSHAHLDHMGSAHEFPTAAHTQTSSPATRHPGHGQARRWRPSSGWATRCPLLISARPDAAIIDHYLKE